METLRRWVPGVPTVNYDVNLLPTKPGWVKALREGNHPWASVGSNFGLERYDWNLTVAGRSHAPLREGEWRATTIGLNLDDGSLYPDQ